MCLLKNDVAPKTRRRLLPLSPALKLAFIGPHANSSLDLLGNDYNQDNKAIHGQTPLRGARRAGLSVSFQPGCVDGIKCAQTSGFGAAVSAAAAADVAVVFLGISEQVENEGRDRTDLKLPGHQADLALAVSKAQPSTIVVLAHGGIVEIDDLLSSASIPAILTMFYPGSSKNNSPH